MASYVYQTRFFWILCFALVLLSGFATCLGPVGPPGLKCSGKCIDGPTCNKSCIDQGNKNVTKVVARTTQKNPTGIHEISETTTLVAQVAEIHKKMKNMISSPDVIAAEPEKIATTLSSRTLRSLPSTTETPASASGSKNFETCKVIKLRSRKDVETTDKSPSHSRDDLSTQSSLEELNEEEEESL
ncbi:hypothetical protein KIW84_034483 [Lathyrus oleraceus]|uniref:Uncharacterized protein n=1 Tax=Pisum sativum TaxID=3888 RepID=A0A9D4XZL0_PEA|nr:hypothetical protein KIW84_034483 [Pisum sativum]